MRILSVDTSSERGSVAIVENGESVAEIRLASSVRHAERLFRSIEFLFQYLDFSLPDVDLFVVARGPGSFTGLRVGLAAMEGFITVYGKPCAGVSTLEALAWKTQIQNQTIATLIDARRGEVYGALYRREGKELVEELSPLVLKPAEWFPSLPRRPIKFCGDGSLRHRTMIEQVPGWKVHEMSPYLAVAMAEIGRMRGGGPLEPLYIRKSDAEITGTRRNENNSG